MGRKFKVGFIGCGNMGSAMLKGIVASGKVKKSEVAAAEKFEAGRKKIEELGVYVTSDNGELVRESDVIFLVVKPYQQEEVL
nr:NAD(P)-binding domain-containing protein [Lachnospiraceae bacterium]